MTESEKISRQSRWLESIQAILRLSGGNSVFSVPCFPKSATTVAATGPVGGPFTPTFQTYTLTNSGATAGLA